MGSDPSKVGGSGAIQTPLVQQSLAHIRQEVAERQGVSFGWNPVQDALALGNGAHLGWDKLGDFLKDPLMDALLGSQSEAEFKAVLADPAVKAEYDGPTRDGLLKIIQNLQPPAGLTDAQQHNLTLRKAWAANALQAEANHGATSAEPVDPSAGSDGTAPPGAAGDPVRDVTLKGPDGKPMRVYLAPQPASGTTDGEPHSGGSGAGGVTPTGGSGAGVTSTG